jgi:glycosyltransferase involved in cell wall biosynthesis
MSKNPYPWSKTTRLAGHWLRRRDLSKLAGPDDIFLGAEIFTDRRLEFFARMLPEFRGTTAAIFYDAIPLKSPEFTPEARRLGFERYVRALSLFDKVLCISRESADDLDRCWTTMDIRAPESVVEHLAVSFEGERPGPAREKNACPMLLTVSTLEPRKNHRTLLEAAESLWVKGIDFRLVLVGACNDPEAGLVLERVEALKRQGRPIAHVPQADDSMLRALHAECAFTVFPSLFEGFGLPIVESLWFKRPCVCGDRGAVAEVSEGGGCLNVDTRHAQALAQGIERLLSDGALYNKLRLECEGRMFKTWPDYAERVLAHLRAKPGF